MDPILTEWLNLLFRWTHVVAGIAWVGHLYFFNWVNAQVAKTYDADSKKKVVPELMPRALYFFRWGAAYTWVTGILLLALVYYMGGVTMTAESAGKESIIGTAALVLGFLVYDVLWKPMAKNETAGAIVSYVLLGGAAFGLSQVLPGRSLFIHIGAMFGTIMAANVWMRIWPAQRKIVTAIRDGQAPDAALVGLAGLRSKHNTYMSVPLVLFMISNHFPTIYGHDQAWVHVLAISAAGMAMTKLLYNKSAGDAPKKF